VTHFLKEQGINRDSIYYICGNSNMVNELSGYLELEGVKPENIRTEVFF
jgi:ferredoxin-NADP reductase